MNKPAKLVLLLAGGAVLWFGGSLAWEQIHNRRIVREVAAQVGVAPDLLLAVAKTESHFRTSARSSKGALGILQVMPETGREVASRLRLASYDLADPRDSALIGGNYLKELLERYGGDEALALAAYHAGPARVDGWRVKEARLSGREVVARYAFTDTRRYVEKVLNARRSW